MSRIKIDPLPPNRLRHACDLNTFTFKTTEELKPFEGLIGQERDIEALNLGSSIEGAGFNIFVLGEAGYGQRSVVRSVLQQKVQKNQTPEDWVYVNNFDDPHRPKAIQLPPGRGTEFRDAISAFVEELKVAIPAMFESEDYRNRRQLIDKDFEDKNDKSFSELNRKAKSQNVRLLRTPGIAGGLS